MPFEPPEAEIHTPSARAVISRQITDNRISQPVLALSWSRIRSASCVGLEGQRVRRARSRSTGHELPIGHQPIPGAAVMLFVVAAADADAGVGDSGLCGRRTRPHSGHLLRGHPLLPPLGVHDAGVVFASIGEQSKQRHWASGKLDGEESI